MASAAAGTGLYRPGAGRRLDVSGWVAVAIGAVAVVVCLLPAVERAAVVPPAGAAGLCTVADVETRATRLAAVEGHR